MQELLDKLEQNIESFYTHLSETNNKFFCETDSLDTR